MVIHDESNVKEFLKMLEDLNSYHIEIGIFGDGDGGKKHSKGSPITILGIAIVHEFGNSDIGVPERSFIRAGLDVNKVDIEREGEKLLEDVINLRLSVEMFLETMGENIVGKIQTYLSDMTTPPLKQATIDAKGGKTGVLIDTSRLLGAITHKVVKS